MNKDKNVSNGNYLWISYFHSYLNDRGRAGFVMSSQASSAGHTEAQVRRKIVETGDVDVLISIRSNFFYTRSVPCELWHFDRGKPEERRDQVLMIDARNVYRKVNRKINDFSPEQLANLSAIVWLYRGQTDRFVALVQSYLHRTIEEAAAIVEKASAFRKGYEALAESMAPFIESHAQDAALQLLVRDQETAAQACFQMLDHWTGVIGRGSNDARTSTPAAQNEVLAELEELALACRDLVKDVDLVCKLTNRTIDSAERDFDARSDKTWDGRVIARFDRDLESCRTSLADQLKATSYFERQAHWLLSRFPDACFVPVPGLCRAVSRAEIASADWSLSPGRYVGVAPVEAEEDFDFEGILRDIHVELSDLNQEASELAQVIQENLAEMHL